MRVRVRASSASLAVTDYTETDMLGVRYKSVNFGAKKRLKHSPTLSHTLTHSNTLTHIVTYCHTLSHGLTHSNTPSRGRGLGLASHSRVLLLLLWDLGLRAWGLGFRV